LPSNLALLPFTHVCHPERRAQRGVEGSAVAFLPPAQQFPRRGTAAILPAYTFAVEFIKIVLACTLAAILYGIVHDQVTARICLEYFTVFHPPVFLTRSPTLLAFGWGTIATWWAGAIVGILIAVAARFGARAQLSARDLWPLILSLMAFMAICALAFGVIGYFKGVMPAEIYTMLPVSMHRRFLADWWAHSASYASGFLGGLILCAIIVVKRIRSASA
jgi:hypothetical protein